MTEDNKPALRKYYHTALKHEYEELENGLIRVTTQEGMTGIFRLDGSWVEGDLTQANLHMLIWCGGPRLPEPFRYHWMEMPYDFSRPSGWPEPYDVMPSYGKTSRDKD